MCAAVQVLLVTESPTVAVSVAAGFLSLAWCTATTRGQVTTRVRVVPGCHITCCLVRARKCLL